MAFEVTFAIDPMGVANDSTVGLVGLQLTKIGGTFVHWIPDSGRHPALARFAFLNAEDRDGFVAAALQIPGVSVNATH
jgi:hypothetical protein